MIVLIASCVIWFRADGKSITLGLSLPSWYWHRLTTNILTNRKTAEDAEVVEKDGASCGYNPPDQIFVNEL